MRHFFVPPQILAGVVSGTEITLPKEVSHHIKTVLRLALGTELVLGDGQGCCCRCSLVALCTNAASVIIDQQWVVAETALPLELLQGMPTGDKFDLVLQKNTELGVSVFQPLMTQRSQFTVPANKLEKKLERWQRIINEAARQSERAWLPQVFAPLSVPAAVAQCDAALKLMLWEQGTQPLREALPAERPHSVAVLVGPEGGLTSAEAEVAQQHGFIPAALGPRILRTETAGVTISAILQFHYGDFDLVPQRHKPANSQQSIPATGK